MRGSYDWQQALGAAAWGIIAIVVLLAIIAHWKGRR